VPASSSSGSAREIMELIHQLIGEKSEAWEDYSAASVEIVRLKSWIDLLKVVQASVEDETLAARTQLADADTRVEGESYFPRKFSLH